MYLSGTGRGALEWLRQSSLQYPFELLLRLAARMPGKFFQFNFWLLVMAIGLTISPVYCKGLSQWSKLTVAGELAYGRQDYTEAERCFRLAVIESKRGEYSKLRRTSSLYREAETLNRLKKLAESIEVAKEALKLQSPDSLEGPMVWRLKDLLAFDYIGLQKYQEVVDILFPLLKTRENIMGTRGGGYWLQSEMLCDSLLKLGQLAKAEKIAQKMLAVARKQHTRELGFRGYLNLGDVQVLEKRYAEARKSFEQALAAAEDVYKYRIDQSWAAACYNSLCRLGNLAKIEGNYESQRKYMTRAWRFASADANLTLLLKEDARKKMQQLREQQE